jgi:hypothetical protein
MHKTALTALEAGDSGFWRKLCPALSIGSDTALPKNTLPELTETMAVLRYEGYLNLPGVFSDAQVGPLRECVELLHERKIPLPFAFVYDEFWRAFQSLAPLLEAALGKGYRALPDFWVWHVIASEGAHGWEPHRDRVQPTLDADNSPHSLTVWLPLSEATPLNGCIYVLPAHLDERFKERRWDGDDNHKLKRPQDVRALPASAGSVLAWNQAVLHWGGRASRLAAAPRTSMAFEFQRADKPAFNEPLLAADELPSLERRLGLIGKQALQYQHMYPLTDDVAAIAETLKSSFMTPGAAKKPIPDDEWESGSSG